MSPETINQVPQEAIFQCRRNKNYIHMLVIRNSLQRLISFALLGSTHLLSHFFYLIFKNYFLFFKGSYVKFIPGSCTYI